jgi:hypothetical protein
VTGPYDRIRVENGQTLNRRSLGLHKQSITVYHVLGGKRSVEVVQGSYSTSIKASAGTHRGGGAEDCFLSGPVSKTEYLKFQKAQRFCGGASFYRPELYSNGVKVWDDHCHTGWLGDREASYDLQKQFTDYYAHKNALASHLPDKTWHPSTIYVPRYPLWNVGFDHVLREAKKTRGYVDTPGVRRFQYCLNVKLGTSLRVDGTWGRRTRDAMARWELNVGGNGDGIPGEFSSILLGAGFFNLNT